MFTRRLIAFAIFIFGVSIFFLLVFSSHKNSADLAIIDAETAKINDNRFGFNTTSLINPAPLSSAKQKIDNTENNLTNSLAQAYLGEIYKLNPSGITAKGAEQGLNVLNEDTVAQVFESQAEKGFDAEAFTEKDIKITEHNSKQEQLKYIEELYNITRKNFEKFNYTEDEIIDALIKEQNLKPIKEYADIIPAQLTNVLTIEVPSVWSIFHLQVLNVWQKKLVIYSALLQIQDDPLKAYLAFSQVPTILEESVNLEEVLGERLRELAG